MTAPEILRIVVTVATVQLICDVLAYYFIFSTERYTRLLERLQRSKYKLDQIKKEKEATKVTTTTTTNVKKNSKADRNIKKVQRAEEEYTEILSFITRRHTVPKIYTSIIFLILMRVMGLELRGKVMAVLPFTPFTLLRKFTGRGLEFPIEHELQFTNIIGIDENSTSSLVVNDIGQACSFTFIYFLTAMSVKYYINQIFGIQPPPGADSIQSMLDNPQSKRLMKSLGVNPDDILKID